MTDLEHQEAEFDRALRLREEGDFVGASQVLEELATRISRSNRRLLGNVYMQLGNICRKLSNQLGSIRNFAAAVSVLPRSELASLGLFHSLYKDGNSLGALTEMVRYLRLRECADYREIMKEGFREPELRSELKILADEARRLIAKFDAN